MTYGNDEVNKNEINDQIRSPEGGPGDSAGGHRSSDGSGDHTDRQRDQPSPLLLRGRKKKTWQPYAKGAVAMSLGFFAFMAALSASLGMPWGPWYWHATILLVGAGWGAASVGRWGGDYEGYVRREPAA